MTSSSRLLATPSMKWASWSRSECRPEKVSTCIEMQDLCHTDGARPRLVGKKTHRGAAITQALLKVAILGGPLLETL